MNGLLESSAAFSPCRTYRYSLWRRWSTPEQGYAMFIGLNPSTADEVEDDPTIRRCVQFARDWGYGELCMTNIFALLPRLTCLKVTKARQPSHPLYLPRTLKPVPYAPQQQ